MKGIIRYFKKLEPGQTGKVVQIAAPVYRFLTGYVGILNLGLRIIATY